MLPSTKESNGKAVVELPSAHQHIYGNVYVQILGWQNDSAHTANEFSHLHSVLQDKYGFTVSTGYIQTAGEPSTSVKYHFERYKDIPENSLFILAYMGHGALENDALLTISEEINPRISILQHQLEWSVVNEEVKNIGCDVLMFIDSCFSGAIANTNSNDSADHSRELLASGHYFQETPKPPSIYSFTSMLTQHLADLAAKEIPFSVGTLHRKMTVDVLKKVCDLDVLLDGNQSLRAAVPLTQPPMHHFLTDMKNGCHSSIILTPLPKEKQKDYNYRRPSRAAGGVGAMGFRRLFELQLRSPHRTNKISHQMVQNDNPDDNNEKENS